LFFYQHEDPDGLGFPTGEPVFILSTQEISLADQLEILQSLVEEYEEEEEEEPVSETAPETERLRSLAERFLEKE
jgi:hypothetical protein